MIRVLVIGSVNMDVVTPLQRIPAPGETMRVQDVSLVPGGKGANAAVAAARLGAHVQFVGCVGDDAFGERLRAGLEGEGIDCRQLRTSSRSSGTAVILVDEASGQNTIMVGPGANDQVVLPDDEALFEGIDIVMLQLETPIQVNVEAARLAASAGVTVVLDPAPATADVPDELLQMVSIVSPNESELAILTGMPVDDLASAERAAHRLLNRGARIVVAKLGEHGALWLTRDVRHHEPAVSIKAVDTTAAGDTFTGALALGVAEGMDIGSTLRRACCAGALTCTRFGAQPSIPNMDELKAFMTLQRH